MVWYGDRYCMQGLGNRVTLVKRGDRGGVARLPWTLAHNSSVSTIHTVSLIPLS